MSKEYLSQKEIATELKVTKQQVYRCIKKHNFKEAHTEVVNGNTVLMYDKATFEKIKHIFKSNTDTTSRSSGDVHQEAHQETPNEALYEALVKQLEAKDKQIEKLQQALDQAQKLHAMDKQRILELEDKTKAEEPTEEPIKKKKWWQFGR